MTRHTWIVVVLTLCWGHASAKPSETIEGRLEVSWTTVGRVQHELGRNRTHWIVPRNKRRHSEYRLLRQLGFSWIQGKVVWVRVGKELLKAHGQEPLLTLVASLRGQDTVRLQGRRDGNWFLVERVLSHASRRFVSDVWHDGQSLRILVDRVSLPLEARSLASFLRPKRTNQRVNPRLFGLLNLDRQGRATRVTVSEVQALTTGHVAILDAPSKQDQVHVRDGLEPGTRVSVSGAQDGYLRTRWSKWIDASKVALGPPTPKPGKQSRSLAEKIASANRRLD